ncbi:MAG: amidohydrolase [Anaerolineales bacterium]|nr:amidohydrolase [Anaerolineales bacterium]
MILTNGRIYTMNPVQPKISTLVIDGDTIKSAGSDEVLEFEHEKIDLDGLTVIPGLVDAHIHLKWYALTQDWIELHGVNSLEKAVELVRERARRTPAGEWILGTGWNHNNWAGGAFPTAGDLDRAAPDHPVCLTAQSGHACWVNSRALELGGITSDTPNPPGAEIQRGRNGLPTGILAEGGAMDLVQEKIPAPTTSQIKDAMRNAFPKLWAAGITGVHCMDDWTAFQAMQQLYQDGELGIRVVKYLPLDHLDEAIAQQIKSGDGNDWLRIGGLKLFMDGALGVATAALLEAYEDDAQNTGILIMEEPELKQIAHRAAGAGLSLAIHAIGDHAIQIVLDVLEEVPAVSTVPHRIEHVQLLHPSFAGRLAELNITASVQPVHAPSDMEIADRKWGRRTGSAYAFKTLLDKGTRLAFGSDSPVEPVNPLYGIHAAATRRRLDGSPGPDGWHPEQRLTVQQAITGFTLGAAQAAGTSDRLGTLEPGKLADLIVLDRDPFEIDPHEIPHCRIVGVMIGGEWVIPPNG